MSSIRFISHWGSNHFQAKPKRDEYPVSPDGGIVGRFATNRYMKKYIVTEAECRALPCDRPSPAPLPKLVEHLREERLDDLTDDDGCYELQAWPHDTAQPSGLPRKPEMPEYSPQQNELPTRRQDIPKDPPPPDKSVGRYLDTMI